MVKRNPDSLDTDLREILEQNAKCYWTSEEKQKYHQAISKYGKDMKAIQ